MKFEHKVSLPRPKAEVDEALADIPAVARLIPGVEDVRQKADGSYEGTVKVRVGPMAVTLKGDVDVEQDVAAGRWTMRARAQDKRIGGGISATIEARVTEVGPATTELDIVTDVQLMGKLGELGQPLIKRKASDMIKGFADNLRDHLS